MTSTAVAVLEPEQISEVVRRCESIDTRFANALKAGVPPAHALVRLGIHLCMQERNSESLMVLRAAVALAPDDPAVMNNLAVVLERVDQTGEAIHTVERSLALSHAQPDSWIFLGNLKSKQGDLTGALAAYEAALALQPVSPLAWQGLGFVKRTQRQHHEAIACFLTCLQQSGATAPLLSLLGQLFYQTGQFSESRDAYAAATELDPPNPVYHRMHREMRLAAAAIDGTSVEDAVHAYLLARAARPTDRDKDLPHVLQTTFSLLSAYGYKEAAQRVGVHQAALFPANATAAYLLQALSGDSSHARSPDAYLVEHFNEFADRFDQHLVNTLGYDIPQKLGAALAGLLPTGARLDVLDAGCGTGLCGPCVRPFSASLTGVDLSPGMLEHAHRRQVYDRLACCELTAFLTTSPGRFDVIAAADVLIYFGDLVPLAAAIAGSLRPGGLFGFSIERATDSSHELLTSGRFAHDPAYVRSVFQGAFTPCLSRETSIRLEACRPVPGNIFIFRRK